MRFWEDHWAGKAVLNQQFPRLYLYNLSLYHNYKVADITEGSGHSMSWDLGFRRNLFDHEMEQFFSLLWNLENVGQVESRSDSRVWKLDLLLLQVFLQFPERGLCSSNI